MKQLILCGVFLLPLVGSQAMAACTAGTQVTGAALVSLIEGSTACVGSPGNWESQEQHRGTAPSGALWDYKLGPSNPVDPTDELGTWSLNAVDASADTVTYNYSGGDSFSFTVHGPISGTSYSFCSASPEVVAQVLPAITGCTPPP